MRLDASLIWHNDMKCGRGVCRTSSSVTILRRVESDVKVPPSKGVTVPASNLLQIRFMCLIQFFGQTRGNLELAFKKKEEIELHRQVVEARLPRTFYLRIVKVP